VSLATLIIHRRQQSDCVSNDGFCPSWIADNWQRYTHPFWQHVYLTVVAVVIGFVIAAGLAIIATSGTSRLPSAGVDPF